MASATDIAPLGSTTMVLPRPESLRSVRFDGPRGYAITFERTDPLFTLDLSDPADPRQIGELEIPGFVHHMEPRGDRILGLGYDWDHPDGAINVSLFDVSDFANPTMLSRVHFGGDWADFAEGQNQIHKTFTILEELGLLLVPFSGWDYGDGEHGCGSYRSGTQLVDWSDDSLRLRGVAESTGEARRALIHQERLLSISDSAVESFSIANRDAPARTAELTMASNVSSVAVAGGLVVRLSNDWWTGEHALEVSAADDAENPEPLGRLPLVAEQLDSGAEFCYEGGGYGSAELFARGAYAYLLRESYEWYDEGPEGFAERSGSYLDVIDLRDPRTPTMMRSIELPFEPDRGYGWYGVGSQSQRAVQIGSSLVLSRSQRDYDAELERSESAYWVIDLSEPSEPKVLDPIARPDAMAHGSMLRFDDTIISWHMRAANDDGSRVRYYLERLDMSDAQSPTLRPPVNVPGPAFAYDPETKRAMTIDYDRDEDYSFTRELKLVAINDNDTATLLEAVNLESTSGSDEHVHITAVAASTDRVFVHLSRYYDWGWEEDGLGGDGPDYDTDELVIFDGYETLQNEGRLSLKSTGYWAWDMHAVGNTVTFSADTGLAVVDATDHDSASIQIHDLYGYSCWGLKIDGGQAYCPMGQYGLQVLPM